MIKLSAKACARINNLRQEEGAGAEDYLRIEVKRGGCSGFSYKMSFDKNRAPHDHVFAQQDVQIAVSKEHILYLAGLELDYQGGLNGQGFVFDNPNASKNCGCGTSFAV